MAGVDLSTTGPADRNTTVTAAGGTLHLSPAWAKRLQEAGYYPEEFAAMRPPGLTPEEKKQLDVERHSFLDNHLLLEGKPAEALEEFKAALQDDPGNANILLGMADAYSATQKLDEAQKAIDTVLKADPKNVSALVHRAELLIARAEGAGNQKGTLLREAVAALQQAKTLQPRNTNILKSLASAYIGLQDIDKIVQTYREIVKADPSDIQATLVLANVLADTGRAQEAIALYEKVIEERRGFLTTYLFLGQLYEEKLRQSDKAIDIYKRALVIDPRNERIRTRFERVLLRKYGEQNPGAVLAEYGKFAAAYPHSSGIQRLFAERLLAERDFPRAVEQFKKVVELDPDNVDPLIALSQLLLQSRNYDEARKYLERAVDVDPARVDAYNSLAESYVAQNQRDKAVEVYRKALRLNPEADKLLLGLADVLSRTGDAQAAVKTLLETTTATASRPEFLAVLGQAYERARDYPKALEYYNNAFQKAPTSLPVIAKLLALNIRQGHLPQAEGILARVIQAGTMPKDDLFALAGEAFLAEGLADKAAEFYRKAFQANPDSLKLLVRLVEINNIRDQHEENFQLLDRITGTLAGTDEIPELRAQTLLDQKRYPEALEIYRKLQQEHPSSEEWVKTLVDALVLANRHGEALELIQKNHDLLGRDEALTLRGIVLYKAKRYAQAEKLFKELLRKQGASLTNVANFQYYLGSIYLDQQRYDQAENAFRASIQADPTDDKALNALGYMLADQNKKLTEAKGLIEKAQAIRPSAPHILDSLGWVNYRLGNFQEALDYIQRAHRLMGDDPEILDHLGDIYMKLGQVDKAQEAYRRALALDPGRPGLKSKIVGSGK